MVFTPTFFAVLIRDNVQLPIVAVSVGRSIMSNIMRIIHWVIIACLVLTGNTVYDQILGGVIAAISFFYAFSFVGRIAGDLGYSSMLMSLVHWSVRTIIEAGIIFVTRYVYIVINSILSMMIDHSEFISMAIVTIVFIVAAEVLKASYGLKKNYW